MSIQDPISDMLASICNAQVRRHISVECSASFIKQEILRVLKEEGYITDYRSFERDSHPYMMVDLKYYQGHPVIERLRRISKPGLRIYKNAKHLPKVPGFGVAILTTSQGVMTHLQAKTKGIGGEILCEVA